VGPETRALPEGTGGFDTEVYHQRRLRLLETMQKTCTSGGNPDGRCLGVVYAAPVIDPDTDGRQDANFYYLSGLDEAGAAVVLDTGAQELKERLFLQNRDPEDERWTGDRLPVSRELEVRTGFTRIRRMTLLGTSLSAAAESDHSLVFLGPIVPPDADVPVALQTLDNLEERIPGLDMHDLGMEIARMREVKEPGELSLMEEAIDHTRQGDEAAMAAVAPGLSESQLKNVIEDAFRAAGSQRFAFPSIVGSGPDSTVLHYPYDDRVMQAGDLVVCDTGSEVDGYASDITRTLPVSGHYTDAQRQIYNVVLAAQNAAIAAARPGVYVSDVDDAARKVIADAGYYDYFPHGTSHFVGLEVHDAGDYAAPLPAGAVITVEPGIYLPSQGFGIRIEDEIRITPTGAELLSSAIPRTAEEIEAFIANAQKQK
jgi:Xaa-Pro aminopeptidase